MLLEKPAKLRRSGATIASKILKPYEVYGILSYMYGFGVNGCTWWSEKL